MLSEAFDGAALTRRVTAFEEHNNPLPAGVHSRVRLSWAVAES